MEQVVNFGHTTLAEALDDTEVGVDVADGSVFSASGDFRVVVDDEIMKVTARSGNTLTVTRGAEGTTAASHSNGAAIDARLTAAGLTNIVAEGSPAASTDVATVATDESTTSTSYTDLATSGPAVTVTVNTKAQVVISSRLYGGAATYGKASFALSGANTLAADDGRAIQFGEANYDCQGSRTVTLTGLTPGSTTATMKYRSHNGGTVHYLSREIAVVPLD